MSGRLCTKMRLGRPVIGCVLAAPSVRLASCRRWHVVVLLFWSDPLSHSTAAPRHAESRASIGFRRFKLQRHGNLSTARAACGPSRKPIPSPAHRMALLSAIGPWRETILLAEATSHHHPESGLRRVSSVPNVGPDTPHPCHGRSRPTLRAFLEKPIPLFAQQPPPAFCFVSSTWAFHVSPQSSGVKLTTNHAPAFPTDQLNARTSWPVSATRHYRTTPAFKSCLEASILA